MTENKNFHEQTFNSDIVPDDWNKSPLSLNNYSKLINYLKEEQLHLSEYTNSIELIKSKNGGPIFHQNVKLLSEFNTIISEYTKKLSENYNEMRKFTLLPNVLARYTIADLMKYRLRLSNYIRDDEKKLEKSRYNLETKNIEN